MVKIRGGSCVCTVRCVIRWRCGPAKLVAPKDMRA